MWEAPLGAEAFEKERVAEEAHENARGDQRREALEQEDTADDDEQEFEVADERDQRQQPTQRQRAAIAHDEPRAPFGATRATTPPLEGQLNGR